MKTNHLQIMEHWIGKIADDNWWENIGDVLFHRGVLDFYDCGNRLYTVENEDGHEQLLSTEETLAYILEWKGKKRKIGKVKKNAVRELKIRCFNCTSIFHLGRGALQRCHIISDSKDGEDTPSNLIPLCKHCHGISPENDKEAMWNFLKRVGGKNYWPQKALDLYITLYGRFPSLQGLRDIGWSINNEASERHVSLFRELCEVTKPPSWRDAEGIQNFLKTLDEDSEKINEELMSFATAHPFNPDTHHWGNTSMSDVVKAINNTENANNWNTLPL
jgi:5-methylcytosine-specific restriction endonuclease McrA